MLSGFNLKWYDTAGMLLCAGLALWLLSRGIINSVQFGGLMAIIYLTGCFAELARRLERVLEQLGSIEETLDEVQYRQRITRRHDDG